MKTSRFSDSQILAILKQAENGVPVTELCREHGMSSATFYGSVQNFSHILQQPVGKAWFRIELQ